MRLYLGSCSVFGFKSFFSGRNVEKVKNQKGIKDDCKVLSLVIVMILIELVSKDVSKFGEKISLVQSILNVG